MIILSCGCIVSQFTLALQKNAARSAMFMPMAYPRRLHSELCYFSTSFMVCICFYILPVRCFLTYCHVYFQALPVNAMGEILVKIMVAAKKIHLGIFVVSVKEDIQVRHPFCT